MADSTTLVPSGPWDQPSRALRLVLASRSPQRRAILESLGVRFALRPSDFAEIEEGQADEVATANALGKARAAAREDGEVVLGVDTVVSLGGRLYGKPADVDEARATLRALSAQTHTVVSAVALVGDGPPSVASAATAVRFRRLDEETVEWYLAGGEWRERAGGYAIQGAGCALVAAIDGDWTNVVGLPVATLLALAPGLLRSCNDLFNARDPLELQP
jgi:septum formation protein